jgi:hypothetical protein
MRPSHQQNVLQSTARSMPHNQPLHDSTCTRSGLRVDSTLKFEASINSIAWPLSVTGALHFYGV